MHSIKKISLTVIAFFSISSVCQEITLPDEVWQPIVIYALIATPSDARNLAFASKQLYTIIQIPYVVKTAIALRQYPIMTHYEIAQRMRIPAITKPYIDANETLLTITELLIYEETMKKNPYADINYEGSRKNKLEMICSDYPEYKLNWIELLTKNGARENNTHASKVTALSAVIERYKQHSNCQNLPCCQIKDTYYTIIKVLLENGGANPSLHIHQAIDARHAPVVQLLIDYGATIKHHDYVWLHNYLCKDKIDENALRFLLDQGYDPYLNGIQRCGGGCQHTLNNAVQTVTNRFAPSEEKDRILDLLRQYPKKKSE